VSAPDPDADRKRLDYTLATVAREAEHLATSRAMVFSDRVVDAAWVEALRNDATMAAFVEAFASRFGRMQDTIIDRLLPRLLTALGERPGSAIDNLNRAEQLAWVNSAADWKATRTLRNRLVHEYMDDPQTFAEALNLANECTHDMLETHKRISTYIRDRLDPHRHK